MLTAEGVAMPAIVVNVLELVAAGIDRIVIVVQPDDLPSFSRLFKEKVAPGNYNKLSPQMKKVANQILELGTKVEFVVQERQEGFGHAVYTARHAVGMEPFMVVLSDHVYKSHRPDVNCAAQLLQAYQRDMSPIIGLKESPASDVSAFGCATGAWIDLAAGHGPGAHAGTAPGSSSSSGGGGNHSNSDVSGDVSSGAFGVPTPTPHALSEDQRAAFAPVSSSSAHAAGADDEGDGGGEPAHDHPRLLNVTQLAEKPSVEYARRHLGGMPMLEEDVFLTVRDA